MKCCAECSYKHDPVLLCQMPIPVSDSNEATQDLYGNGCSAGWWCCVRYCSPPLDQQQERISVAWVPKALFPMPGTHCGQIDFDGGWSQGFQAEEGSEVSNREFGGREG